MLRRCTRLVSLRALSSAAAAAGAPPDVAAAVVGGGAVGVAAARALAARLPGADVLLLEAGDRLGGGETSRSSEVIHAGLYYPPGSLKAQLCVAGRSMLYSFCEAHGVPHRRLGKLVVAARAEQLPALAALAARGAANGVAGLRLLGAAEAAALEPRLRCAAALLSPYTGIVDSHALVAELARQFEAAGGAVATRARVVGGALAGAAGAPHALRVADAGGGEVTVTARHVVVAAGTRSQAVAAALGLPAASIPPLRLAKGSYFSVALPGGEGFESAAGFSRLIYPLPSDDGGLGVHLTLDLGGGARLGPDVQWLPPGARPEDADYAVDAARGAAFEAAARAWWPSLPAGCLRPAYAGLRAKVAGPGEPPGDFVVAGAGAHGVPGVAALYGIESPGLTSCLALGEAAAAAALGVGAAAG